MRRMRDCGGRRYRLELELAHWWMRSEQMKQEPQIGGDAWMEQESCERLLPRWWRVLMMSLRKVHQ